MVKKCKKGYSRKGKKCVKTKSFKIKVDKDKLLKLIMNSKDTMTIIDFNKSIDSLNLSKRETELLKVKW